MEWLTREFTAIEKVRRNVVLLGALAYLLAFFPVASDKISLLGAEFASEVLAFAIFHGLIFYTLTLCVRSIINISLTQFERVQFEHDMEKRLDDLDKQQPRRTADELESAIQSMEAEESAAQDQRALERRARDAAWEKMREELQERRRTLEAGIAEGLMGDFRAAQAREEIAQCSAREAKILEQLAQFRLQASYEDARPRPSTRQRRLLAELEQRRQQRRETMAQQAPFANLIYGYVFLGEYLFPIGFGLLAANLLYQSQDITMLGELLTPPTVTPE